uniref:Uncharacterized protein n=1 Tax=Rhizophora mucronata TaxID=61149 RepID=A0A2P2PDA2_RHIMU
MHRNLKIGHAYFSTELILAADLNFKLTIP